MRGRLVEIQATRLLRERAAFRNTRLLVRIPRLDTRRALLLASLVFAAVLGHEIGTIQRLARRIAPVVQSDLWTFPSRIYAGPLVVRAGLPLDANEFVDRLKRLGYTESQQFPRRPHEFRRTGSDVELFTGSVDLPGRKVPGRSARVSFRAGGTVGGIRDPTGRRLREVVVEPEQLAVLAGEDAEDRTVLSLSEFPDHLIQAVISAEDRRFYRHAGIDPWSILRALTANLRNGGIVQGGSTITQQTVKNLFLGSERTWSRKWKEARMALALESLCSKERILEIYLNEVYLGQREAVAICGFGEASRYYLGKEPRDLDLSESALLAGLVRAPIASNPFKHLDRALARRNGVLAAMREQGKISETDYRAALDKTPRLAENPTESQGAPFLAQAIRSELLARYPTPTILHGGLRIYTTLDPHLQAVAEQAVQNGLERLEQDHRRLRDRAGALEAAMIVLDPRDGKILALVGGRDFSRSQFDHALMARRQAGSLFKPLIYLAGFEHTAQDPAFGFTPATLLDDSPVEIDAADGIWSPQNYDEQFRGPVTVRRALEESINVPAVRASQQIGLDAVARVARACGLELPAAYPSLALGAAQVTPLDMARAYATIANGGYAVEPSNLLGIVDRTGAVLEQTSGRPRRVVSATAARLTLDLMRGVLARGTGQRVRAEGIDGDFAGKTGTTNDKRDAWFIGFSPSLLAAVWVGFDDDSPTGLTGSEGALPIWIDFIRRSGRWSSGGSFPEPSGITYVRIDPYTGGLATDRCPEVLDEVFQAGTEPSAPCALHGGGFARSLADATAGSRLLAHWQDVSPLVSYEGPSEPDRPR